MEVMLTSKISCRICKGKKEISSWFLNVTDIKAKEREKSSKLFLFSYTYVLVLSLQALVALLLGLEHSLRMVLLGQVGKCWWEMSIAGTKVSYCNIMAFLISRNHWSMSWVRFKDWGVKEELLLWFAEANMLYLETPAGVGFSYATDSSYYESVDDKMTGIFVFTHLWPPPFYFSQYISLSTCLAFNKM